MPKQIDTSDLEQLEADLLELIKRAMHDDVPADVFTAISNAHTNLVIALGQIEESNRRTLFNRKKK